MAGLSSKSCLEGAGVRAVHDAVRVRIVVGVHLPLAGGVGGYVYALAIALSTKK